MRSNQTKLGSKLDCNEGLDVKSWSPLAFLNLKTIEFENLDIKTGKGFSTLIDILDGVLEIVIERDRQSLCFPFQKNSSRTLAEDLADQGGLKIAHQVCTPFLSFV